MKKFIIIAVFMFCLPFIVTAQSTIKNCGYVPDKAYILKLKDPNSILNKRFQFLRKIPIKNIYKMQKIDYNKGQFKVIKPVWVESESVEADNLLNSTRIIPIVAHVIRRSNGSGGISTTSLNSSISRANDFYNAFNMTFEVCEIKYIDSDTIYNTNFNSSNDQPSNSASTIVVMNVTSRNIERKLNIYFVPNSNTSWAWRPNTNTKKQHILMKNSHANNATTLTHEIGHWFSLMHTHGDGNELVNGSNCATAGDFICDTPADPNLSGRVNTACTYTGGSNVVDNNGSTYNPDTRNLLSYARKSCRNKFSEGQILRMQSSLLGMDTDRGYTLLSCNGVGKRVATYKWGEGWTNTEFFKVNNQTYLFLLKQIGLSGSSKTVHIHKMNNNGKVGQRVADYKWGEGWTNTEFFTINGQTYLFLLKQRGLSGSDKTVHIHKMNSNGKVGQRVAAYKWGEGWTNTEFFTINGQTYLFLLKQRGLSGSNKTVHIHKMNSNGKVGQRVAAYKWGEGWTNTEFYTINGQTYLFLLKQRGLSGSNKTVHIHKMNSNGKVGRRIVAYKWGENWTNTEFFTINDQTYLFLLKQRGLSGSDKTVHIHKMNNNGKVGQRVADYKWGEGWTNTEFFNINNKTFLFLLKQKGLSGSNKTVHIHKMK